MKININYVLNQELSKICEEINNNINQKTEGGINFSSGECRPHVTLLMGEVDESNLDKVMKIVESIDYKALFKDIQFKKPTIKGKYIMADIVDESAFKEDCQNLISKLDEMLEPSHFSIANGTSTPHITLGFGKKTPELEEYINNLEPLPNTNFNTISMAEAGSHGTVLVKNTKISESIK